MVNRSRLNGSWKMRKNSASKGPLFYRHVTEMKFCRISICKSPFLVKFSGHQCGYFLPSKMTSNSRTMRFCTANMLQSDNMPIQNLIQSKVEINIEDKIAVAYILIRIMQKKERIKKASKRVGYENFNKEMRKMLLYFFTMSAGTYAH